MTSHRGDAVPSPAHPLLRSSAAAVIRTGGPGGAASPSAALHIACGPEGLACARSFTRDTLRGWSLGHRCDDATLVITELATNAVTHAAPRCAGAQDVRLGFRLEPAHLLLTVSDPDDRPPVRTPGTGAALEEHGRGLHIVDALSEAWGWTPAPPAGKTVWARLSTHPPI
ncbi:MULTISPECIES: ATP-binding protein [Streptomyces]|uniref:ATP-binding protein n=1 Tax=Streptomyces sp. NA02536 TaxID=2742133 RepID=UPI00158FA0A9|nr:ATP-binding protein [Streptomyces sp. NA02536]QKW04540.1 ATP-binding protein [Streptomyces sp. NA02536]